MEVLQKNNDHQGM